VVCKEIHRVEFLDVYLYVGVSFFFPFLCDSVEESEGEDSLMGVVDKDLARSLSSESSMQTTWIEVSRTLVHQLLGRGARYGSLAGGEVGKQLFVSNSSYPPSSPLRHPLLAGGVRFKGTKMSKKGLKRKKAREVRLKLKKIRKEKKAKKAAMSPEQRLEHGIYKVTFLLPMLEYL